MRYEAVPPQFEETQEESPDEAAEPEWARLFEEAGLDRQAFQPVTPAWTPPMNTDTRAAWERSEEHIFEL